MLNKINLGIVGLGHLGCFHVEQTLKIKQLNLVGVHDINQEVAIGVEKKFGVKRFPSLIQLFNSCYAISVVCSTINHFDVCLAALGSDCHVFVEKPITHDVKQAEKLILYAKKKKLKIQVGHIERFNPAFLAFAQTNPKSFFI